VGAFAVWITGLPASGKSTLAAALAGALRARGRDVAVLESDEWRRILTPEPTWSERERDRFYGALARIGRLLTEHGVPVIFDATANRRRYREAARRDIPRLLEAYVDCPLEVCRARDPKGIYARAAAGAGTVPGLQVPYEPPERPDMVVRGDSPDVGRAVADVLACLRARGYLV
jgi:adenylylsulfate kinase